MALAPGTRIGRYEITASLGAGGMGEVYRALDTRLERSVAIKSLPQEFSADPERLARFEREAKLLAAVNHPNIAGIHGIEDLAGMPCLVLEFVDGETLAARLARGPLGVRETLDLGAQIAGAVEAAHERGIVHRDLKPGNVMLVGSRVVKVLDFGLAKGAAASDSSPQLSAMPTVAVTATGAGIILGTAPYMSPEQARGRAVDRRTDIWALGCILYECLTGRRAFEGDTVSDVIARIIEREPDWSVLPAGVPSRVRDLVRRCLTKDPDARPRDVGDLRRELSAIALDLSSAPVGEPAATSGTPSLAVLYFENLANDADSEYFCSGITEDILTDLSKIKGLRVASRNAVSRYRNAAPDLARVGAELGVRAVLQGTVRRAGERVRITVQLVNAADGFQLWAERYDRTLQDVFAVQEEIASSIAEALRVALTPSETKQLVQNRPNDARAYDLYLKGRAEYAHYTQESLKKALALFQEAIAIDDRYALAWAGVADVHGQMVQFELDLASDAEHVRLGLEAARRAIALNPKLAEAHKAEALVLRYTGDREGVSAALRRAVEANPRHTPALINLGLDRFMVGDLAGDERLIRRAVELDPDQPFSLIWLGVLLQMTNRWDEVMEIAERVRKRADDPFFLGASYYLRVRVAADRGDLEGAQKIVDTALAEGADPENTRAVGASIAARTGREDEARRALDQLESSKELRLGGLLGLATTAARLGLIDRGVALMNRRFALDTAPMFVRLLPDLHPLLGHQPFSPRQWDTTLVWPLEAPMIDRTRHALFKHVRIESGLPDGSDIRLASSAP